MTRKLPITRFILAIIVVSLFGLAGFGYNSYRTSLNSLGQLNKERLSWTAGQLEIEFLRFLKSLTALEAGEENVSVKSVQNRFDILWSRMALTQRGSVGARLREFDSKEGALEQVFDVMKAKEQDVVNLNASDSATIFSLINAFSAKSQSMRDFHRNVFHTEEHALSDIRANLEQSSVRTALATFVAFLIGTVLVVLVSNENRRNRRTAAHNLALAAEAEQANKAKSSFLTMMSHELRTPMNGVLGMLALTKETGLAEPQTRLIEQAERSGQQMIAMLADILDFASLQDKEITFAKKPFEPRQLAASVNELFGAVARREGIAFEVDCDDACPARIEGDFRRLRQIIAHFASYIVETAGTRRVDIDIAHQDDRLSVAINFDYGIAGDNSDAWHPDIILGERDVNDDKFASDALGPAVARGLLDRMGGDVGLDYHEDGRIAIVLNVPARPVSMTSPVVHIETRSQSLNTICRMSLMGDEFRIHEPGGMDTVNIVLLEGGGMNEAENVQMMNDAFPNAMMFAIGSAINPSDFDGVIETPLDISALRQSIKDRIAV